MDIIFENLRDDFSNIEDILLNDIDIIKNNGERKTNGKENILSFECPIEYWAGRV